MAGNKSKKSTGSKSKAPLDDAALLRHAFADVQPLPGREINKVPPPPIRKPKVPARPTAPARTAAPAAPPKLPELGHGDAPGVEKRLQQKMRRGQIEIEGRLDLHGMTQSEAHPALTDFIVRAQAADKRCVLVITGKGTRLDGGIGVLREAVPKWLNQAGLRERIQSFRHAAPRDGGDGALYILLRRFK